MASSSWSSKLETRLAALGDGASKESLQSLAKWIGFNRKHGKAFCKTLQERLSTTLQEPAAATTGEHDAASANSNNTNSPTRQWLCLLLIHQVLLLEVDNPTKWEKLGELRLAFGETVVLPTVRERCKTHDNDSTTTGNNEHPYLTKDRLTPLVKEWQTHNVFGKKSPALIQQMQQILSGEEIIAQDLNEETREEQAKAAIPVVSAAKAEPLAPEPEKLTKEGSQEEVVAPLEVKTPVKEEKEVATTVVATKVEPEKAAKRPPAPPRPPLNRSLSVEDIPFDFEASGIPYSKVESREFLEPCKAIATLQIARDLRNDAAVQLSSRLSALPEQVKEYCRQTQEQAEAAAGNDDSVDAPLELSEEEALKFAQLIGDDLLDTDLDEALLNVKTFMSIVEQQKQARQQLIQLLIQSRCQFGSDEAAEVFYGLDEILGGIKERKQLLSDAMDLEGLDAEAAEDPKEAEKERNAAASLKPLSWYKPDGAEPAAKRAKVE